MPGEIDDSGLEKVSEGVYTIRDYKQPKSVSTDDLRKVAEDARKVHIVIPRKPAIDTPDF
jgi:hypothetical protein